MKLSSLPSALPPLVLGAVLAVRLAAPAFAADAERRTPVVVAVERASPAVVNISTEQVVVAQPDPFFDQFFNDFFEQPRGQRYTRTSLGSGVIVRPDGYVVTNAHVVARGAKIKVTLADERDFEAKIVGSDSDADLAVLKIAGDGLPHITFGNSDDLMIGETVIAIGNPFGFSHSVTSGVVSAVGRSLRSDNRSYLDFIQTDASINPGNSGGPLLNIKGELIGINTAIYGKAQGIGFAIPANRARRSVDDLIRYGEIKRGYFGARVQDLTPELAGALGVPQSRGVVVREVEDRSPAASAGLRPGDLVLAIDGHDVKSREEFDQRTAALAEGDTSRLDVQRDGRKLALEVHAAALDKERLDDIGWRLLGIRVKPAARGRSLEISEVRRQSALDRAGVRAGDALIGLEGEPVDTLAAYREAIAKLRSAAQAEVAVQRGRAQYSLTIPLGD
ncbi:MAG TPA: trypsin-like peptidase domain-containing protein [Candidatus Bathyarchaeia archaeon]|nr:trypsin-like peptidase domain-containing protein [Candidatus Bathyarchaeia archaeon]